MIKRIVKMTFREEAVPEFLAIFEESKNKIKAFKGCQHLELLQGTSQPYLLFTLSYWENEDALDAYRQSDLFKATWKKTKALFAQKAEAWSVEEVRE
ncbi:MAG: antibiotic biosynthesis monooxygenase [Lewinellaceae bacterium]|nr:antibiotic biosynthesis monooxygenase [Saprospiraceae bacterium]MCB9339437.1 antibiotic biosynthesis monooxygenase [Lewinellaceae bacterium]